MASFGSHISNTNNPHEDTKSDLGLGYIQNYPVATEQETLALERDDRYVDRDQREWVERAFKKYLQDLGLIDDDGYLIVIPDDVGDVTFAIDSSNNAWLEGKAYKGDRVDIKIIKDGDGVLNDTHNETSGDDHAWEASIADHDFNHGEEYKARIWLYEQGELIGLRTVDWIDGDLALFEAHMAEENPHLVSPANVGLGLVENETPSTPYSGKNEIEQALDDWGFVKIKY